MVFLFYPGAPYASHFLKMMLALVPPKPKLLDIAYPHSMCFEPSLV